MKVSLIFVILPLFDLSSGIQSDVFFDLNGRGYQVCNVTFGCSNPRHDCITWNPDELGLCTDLRQTSRCTFTSDCPDYSQACQITLIDVRGSEGAPILEGVCLPVLFYAQNPISCSQDFMHPLPCHSRLGNERGIFLMGKYANRHCHNYNGLMGKCLPYHCESHIDCGPVLTEGNYVFMGSCMHNKKCHFEVQSAISKLIDPRPVVLNILRDIRHNVVEPK